ncbi:MAG: chloramphenicol acetyltransferase [Flavobacteriaceae bacterium]|nr:chloramphenicol acetyltransferase [Flavobacteriaceae bacterium]
MMKDALFTPIDLETWSRKEYFTYYRDKLKSKYTISIKIEITKLHQQYKVKGYKFYPTFMYVIMRAINQNEAFRTVYHQGKLGTWNYMNPSFTIFHEDDKTFSDLWSNYSENFTTFHTIILNDINTYRDVKGIKIRPNQPPNFIPISCVPWISFESISQDTITDNDFMHTIVRFGKFYTENNKTFIPLSIYVNHAVADGYHSSKLINDIQAIADQVEQWMP